LASIWPKPNCGSKVFDAAVVEADRHKGSTDLGRLPHVMFFGGGVMSKLGDEVIGSIGAAGAPGAKLDDGNALQDALNRLVAAELIFRDRKVNSHHERFLLWLFPHRYSVRHSAQTYPPPHR
jgi:hypothetical protein